jgi:hypothetical protein
MAMAHLEGKVSLITGGGRWAAYLSTVSVPAGLLDDDPRCASQTSRLC